MKSRTWLMVVMAWIAIVALAGCAGAENAAEKAGEAVGEAAERAGEAVGKAAENAGEAAGELAENAGETVGEMAEDAGEAVGDAIENARQALASKETELSELKKRVEGMSAQDLLSDEGKALKEKYDAVAREVEELKQKIAG